LQIADNVADPPAESSGDYDEEEGEESEEESENGEKWSDALQQDPQSQQK